MSRILLVDDEESLVEGLAYALRRAEYDVVTAGDGIAALELGLAESYDLVVLDLMLPGLSGLEVCERIRRAQNLPNSRVPIIILTAKDSERDVVAGFAAGADDYITKPFSSVELLSRVNAQLRRRDLDRADHAVSLRVGSIEIDLIRDAVTVDGHHVQVTPTEFKVLSLLASTPGRVYTRNEIMHHIWGADFVGETHTCEVHISSLRQKLERDPREPHQLVTVRGVGYVLRP